MEPLFDVAIIGMGFAGAALAVHLLERLPEGSSLGLVSGDGAVGEGLAYSTRNSVHLLNVPVYRISMMADDPHHFIRWLWSRKDEGGDGTLPAAGYSYVERSTYAAYVRSTFDKAVGEHGGRMPVRLMRGTAVALNSQGDGTNVVTLSDGRTLRCRYAALCLGNGVGGLPIPPARVAPEARGRIIDHPYRDPRLDEIAGDARVLLVGTGLTMVDAALGLAARGFRGPMTALSRHGLLPHAQVEPRPTPVQAVDIDSPGDLIAVFRTVRDAARALIAEGGDWRAVIDGVRPKTQQLWQGLSERDKRRFLRHLNVYWTIHRHRMAPAAIERLRALIESSRLQVVAGKIGAISVEGDGLAVTVRRRGESEIEALPFDWIVNCAALDRSNVAAAQPLVAGLYEDGTARPDPLGLGIDVDPTSHLLDRTGGAHGTLFALGPPTVGRFFEITAVAEIRAQAKAVATRIADELSARQGVPTG